MTHQLGDPVSDVTNRHHYLTRVIPGAKFKFVPYLEIKILEGGGLYLPLYANYSMKRVYAGRFNIFNFKKIIWKLIILESTG